MTSPNIIPRSAASTIARLAKGFPVVAITGPRQSGKTTLAKACFPDKPYVNLEAPDVLGFAQDDPRGFLAQFPRGAIIDEAQRWPELFSWLQILVDSRNTMGDFILTGSSQFTLHQSITQSLAGRVGLVELLPLSVEELKAGGFEETQLDRALLAGGYPSLYSRDVRPSDWFASYVATYIQRDIREILNIRDLDQFRRFLVTCATRSGQLLNMQSLGNDLGLSGVTIKHWLSALEASYIIRRVYPHHQNFGKRLVKTPKLYFLDVGLMAWLLGIRDTATLTAHPLRGALFETFVLSELVKAPLVRDGEASLFFWRDHIGQEVDFILEAGRHLHGIEVKSSRTISSDAAVSLAKWQYLAEPGPAAPQRTSCHLVYGGSDSFTRSGCQFWGWQSVAGLVATDPHAL